MITFICINWFQIEIKDIYLLITLLIVKIIIIRIWKQIHRKLHFLKQIFLYYEYQTQHNLSYHVYIQEKYTTLLSI